MLNIFKNKQMQGEEVVLKIKGMHCSACSLNIDDTLEEIPGVYESNTSYAKAITTARIDLAKVKVTKLKSSIENLGYTVA